MVAHSLQFGSNYHVSSDSFRVQITEYTDYNHVMAALYYVGEELEILMRTNKNLLNLQRPQNICQEPLNDFLLETDPPKFGTIILKTFSRFYTN